MHYYVYLLTNPSRRAFFVGIAPDLDAALAQARVQDEVYTKKQGVTQLIYYTRTADYNAAVRIADEIRALPRGKKLELKTPELED